MRGISFIKIQRDFDTNTKFYHFVCGNISEPPSKRSIDFDSSQGIQRVLSLFFSVAEIILIEFETIFDRMS